MLVLNLDEVEKQLIIHDISRKAFDLYKIDENLDYNG